MDTWTWGSGPQPRKQDGHGGSNEIFRVYGGSLMEELTGTLAQSNSRALCSLLP